MRARAAILFLLWLGALALPAMAQRDYLTPQEVDDLRDEQEPAKRVLLLISFAQRRIDAVKANMATPSSKRGREIQKKLTEYTGVLETLQTTLDDAREKRLGLDKSLKELEKRADEFLQYLQSLQSENSPGYADYQYTLDESISMTEDELEEAKKGSFPDVDKRTPPTEFPSAPPRARQEDKPADKEKGPPRKKGSL